MSPHLKFLHMTRKFSTDNVRGVRDKYQVCFKQQTGFPQKLLIETKEFSYLYGIFHMPILLANIDFKTWAKFHCLGIFSSLFGRLWNPQSKLTNIRPFLLVLSCFLQQTGLSQNKVCECPQRAKDSPKQPQGSAIWWITSSQKLGRCVSCRLRSVWKSLGWVSFGSKKFEPKILAYL